MKYSIRYLPSARQDLINLVHYLVKEYGANEAAENLLKEIDRRIAHLSEFPYAHPLYASPMRLPIEIRYLPVKNHIVFYTVLEPAHAVEIRRVLYARQNIAMQEI